MEIFCDNWLNEFFFSFLRLVVGNFVFNRGFFFLLCCVLVLEMNCVLGRIEFVEVENLEVILYVLIINFINKNRDFFYKDK